MPPGTLTDKSIKILVLYHSWPIQVTTIQPGWVRLVKRCSCYGSSLKKKNSKENPKLELLTRDQGFLSPLYTLVGYYINSHTDPQNLADDKSQIHTFMFGGLVLLGLSCALFLGDVTTSLEIFIEGVKKKLTVRQWITRFHWFNYLISPNWYSVQGTGLFNWSSCFQNQIKN